MAKKFEIRNSTAEFLIFMAEGKEDGVEVMYADETIWCTQDAIAQLFDMGRSTITEHLSNFSYLVNIVIFTFTYSSLLFSYTQFI